MDFKDGMSLALQAASTSSVSCLSSQIRALYHHIITAQSNQSKHNQLFVDCVRNERTAAANRPVTEMLLLYCSVHYSITHLLELFILFESSVSDKFIDDN